MLFSRLRVCARGTRALRAAEVPPACNRRQCARLQRGDFLEALPPLLQDLQWTPWKEERSRRYCAVYRQEQASMAGGKLAEHEWAVVAQGLKGTVGDRQWLQEGLYPKANCSWRVGLQTR